METLSVLLALCAGNSPVTGEFPTQRPVTRIFDVFFDLHLNKRLSKNREAGDLRRHNVHYGVTVMLSEIWIKIMYNGLNRRERIWKYRLQMIVFGPNVSSQSS